MKKNKGDEQMEMIGQFFISFFKVCASGLKKTIRTVPLLILLIVVIAVTITVMLNQDKLISIWNLEKTFNVPKLILKFVWFVPILTLYIIGSTQSEDGGKYQAAFESIKFANRAGQYPELVGTRIDGKKQILSFSGKGISVSEWRNRWTDLESALDCNILRISIDPKTKTVVHLETVPSTYSIATNIPWNPKYVSEKDFVLVAGQGLLEPVELNLDKYPHALVGGATGSGKSVVLRALLWQCILKGAQPYMIDFKGGIELSAFEDFGEMVYERPQALELLKELTKEMTLRLALFRDEGVKNLTEYNHKFPNHPLARIVLACDEVSEMLDKTGLSGADAKIFKEIEAEMAKIARLGRAPGINMLMGTQRPDANVISGQIRNNLTIKIAGRVTDEYASKMILGNAKASALGDILGRFLYTVGADTYEFQGFNFQDSDIIPGHYQKGSLLIDGIGDMEDDLSIIQESYEAEIEECEEEDTLWGFDNIDSL